MELEELFESYLKGKMSKADAGLFETLLKEDPAYQAQFNSYKQNISAKSEFTPASLKNWSISIAIALTIVLGGYFLFNKLSLNPGEKIYSKNYEPFSDQITDIDAIESGLMFEALNAYNLGDFRKASTLFEQENNKSNSDFARLYLGICYLELGRPEKAIPILNFISENSPSATKEIASWFEAMGYFKLNMLEKAKTPLKITAAKPNPYQAEARAILENLN